MLNISNYNKADVLAALYNHSRPQGLGILHFEPKDMTKEEAEALLKEYTYFDYLQGRVMKVDLASDIEFSPHLYDRDNGRGAAERAIKSLEEKVCQTLKT